MPTSRFSIKVKHTLAQRAAYVCSNPDCQKLTTGPHTDPGKALITGEACHINAAAESGARFDRCQTNAQRRCISNAIWLCSSCHTTIDKEEKAYPTELLLKWKESNEGCAKQKNKLRVAEPTSTTAPIDELELSDDPIETPNGGRSRSRRVLMLAVSASAIVFTFAVLSSAHIVLVNPNANHSQHPISGLIPRQDSRTEANQLSNQEGDENNREQHPQTDSKRLAASPVVQDSKKGGTLKASDFEILKTFSNGSYVEQTSHSEPRAQNSAFASERESVREKQLLREPSRRPKTPQSSPLYFPRKGDPEV